MDSPDQKTPQKIIEPDEDRIVLIAETESLEHEVLPMLDEEFNSVQTLRTEQKTLEEIDAIKPHVLIFACNEVATAEQFYLGLYRAGGAFLSSLHESIILCNREEVKRCYELCKSEVFNDFVMFKPIYEPYRLLLTVQQAIERRVLRLDRGHQRHGNNKINTQLSDVAAALDNSTTSCEELDKMARLSTRNLVDSIERNLDQFTDSIESGRADTGIQITDRDVANRVLDRFKRESVQGTVELTTQKLFDKIDHLIETVTSQSNSINQIKNDFEQVSGTDQKRVLLAEDDEIYQEIINELLTAEGFDVDIAADGVQALLKMSSEVYDLIISDISMPQMDGLRLLETLKLCEVHCNIPVVITTGESSKSMLMQCVKSGACSFIVKPFEREFFLKRIEQSMRV